MILLCTATSVEAHACKSGIARSGTGFEILQSGMGLKNARVALEARLAQERLPRPTLIVSTGFAGSWSEELPVGSWAVGRAVRIESGDRHELEDLSRIVHFSPGLLKRWRPAEFLSLSRPQSGDGTSRRGQQSGLPVLVDMESYAWAELSRAHAIPFAILRMISDTPREPLPGAVENFAAAWTASRPLERAGYLARGLSRTVSEPRVLSKFLARSSRLPRRLADGWQEFAAELRNP